MADPLIVVTELDTWVRGWELPLRKAIIRAVTPDKNTTGDLISTFSGIFTQVNQCMDDGMSGGEAFKQLLRLIATHFGYEDTGDSLTTLNAFSVPNGTPFGEFLPKYRVTVNNITHYSYLFSLNESWIVGITRNKINDQFSVMMSDCFPGDLRTAAEPYATLDDMWKVLTKFSTSKVKAENGEQYVVPSLSGLSLNSNSGARSHGRSAAHSTQSWGGQSSRNQQIAKPKQQYVQDVFCISYACWPLATDEHWETVHNVCQTSFTKQLPPLWSPLLKTKADRSAAFAANVGRCLNCHGDGHSLRHCNQPFINRSGVLNPDLGSLNDNDETFQLWLSRMRSWRTKQTQSQTHSGSHQGSGGQYNSQSRRNSRGPRLRQNTGGDQFNYSPPQPQAPPPALTYQPAVGSQVAAPASQNNNARSYGTHNVGNNGRN